VAARTTATRRLNTGLAAPRVAPRSTYTVLYRGRDTAHL